MGFLIRSAFWLSLVLLMIPIDSDAENSGVDPVGPVQAFVAARDAVQDVAGMCERRPEVCETGRAAFHTITSRAREGARMAAELVGEDEAAPDAQAVAAADTSITTGTVSRDE